MKLFIVSTEEYNWDEYDSLVIAANSIDEAINIAEGYLPGEKEIWKVEEIGTHNKNICGVIHKSFHAG